jgi:hypothetical protein
MFESKDSTNVNFINGNYCCELGGTRLMRQHHHTPLRLVLGIQNPLEK